LTVGVFTASFAVAGFFAIQPRAMVNAKQPNASVLLLSSDDIQVWRTAKHFDAADCANERSDVLATRVGIPSAEIAVACGWFGEKDLTLQIGRTVRQQRAQLIFLCVLILGYGWPAYRWLSAAFATGAMDKRLKQRSRTGGQKGRRRRRSRALVEN
jgi:hypothetical protein